MARERKAQAASFGALLGRLRRKAGFASAREFFNSSGGRAYFKCTYAQYANVEAGRSAPTAGLFYKIAVGLRLELTETGIREFILAYLRMTLGSCELFDLVRGTLAESSQAKSASPLRRAIAREIEHGRVVVSRELAAAMYAGPVHYWLSCVFSSDPGLWTPERLAQMLGYPSPAVRKALSDFERLGFLIKEAGGYRSAFPDKILVMPHEELHKRGPGEDARRREMSAKLIAEMARKRGGVDLHHEHFMRASASALRQYYPYLAQTLTGVEIYSEPRTGPDTAMFALELTVRRLFPF